MCMEKFPWSEDRKEDAGWLDCEEQDHIIVSRLELIRLRNDGQSKTRQKKINDPVIVLPFPRKNSSQIVFTPQIERDRFQSL